LCQCVGGAHDFQQGRWELAETNLREALALYRELAIPTGVAASLQRLATLLTARGRLDEALDAATDGVAWARRALMRSHALVRLHGVQARIHLEAGDVAAAEASVREARHAQRDHGMCMSCHAVVLPEAIRTALANGRHADAEADAQSLEEIAARFGGHSWMGLARFGRALVLAAGRQQDQARAAMSAARDEYLAVGDTYNASRCTAG
jgi:hypothetical protein